MDKDNWLSPKCLATMKLHLCANSQSTTFCIELQAPGKNKNKRVTPEKATPHVGLEPTTP